MKELLREAQTEEQPPKGCLNRCLGWLNAEDGTNEEGQRDGTNKEERAMAWSTRRQRKFAVCLKWMYLSHLF